MAKTDHVVEQIKPIAASLLKQAQAKQSDGDYVQADELYREVLTLEPDNAQAMHHLAIMLMDNNQPQKAIPLLSRAIDLNPDNSYLFYNLGLAYQLSNEMQAAIHYYKIAIEFNDTFAQAYNNVGIAYQHLGKIDLANIYLEKAFLTDPKCIEAYYNFSQTHKFTATDIQLIKKIEELSNNDTETENHLIKLHFTLGKIYDDLNDFKTAFIHYEKANTLKYQEFNSAALDRYIDNIIDTYNSTLINDFSSEIETSRKRFIFIVGMPRSGTTLVEQIIASHPLVQSGGEIGFIGDVIDELPDLINSDYPYPQCIPDFSVKAFNQIAQKFNAYLDNMGGNFVNITDKSPINFLHLGLIKILFPQCTIIHVNRDPIATCLSCYFQNFDKQHQYSYNLSSLGRFYKSYQRIMAHWESVLGDEIVKVNYEDIVETPEQTMESLISQCGLNWDSSCLEFYKGDNIVNSASKWQTRQPIYKNSIHKWKNYQEFIDPLVKMIKNN